MKIVIPGGSGQVGTVLAWAFHAAGHEVIVLSRALRTDPDAHCLPMGFMHFHTHSQPCKIIQTCQSWA